MAIMFSTQCNRTRGLDTFFHQIFSEPAKIAVIGSGCSVNTEPTAEISYFYNLNQVSHSTDVTEIIKGIRQ